MLHDRGIIRPEASAGRPFTLLTGCMVSSAGHAQYWSYAWRRLSEDIDCVEYVGFKPQPQSAKDYRSMVLPMINDTYSQASKVATGKQPPAAPAI